MWAERDAAAATGSPCGQDSGRAFWAQPALRAGPGVPVQPQTGLSPAQLGLHCTAGWRLLVFLRGGSSYTRWLGCWPSAADHPCKAHPHPLLISGSAPPTPATPGPAAFREFSRTEPLPACLRSCFLQPSCGGTWLSGEVRALPFLMTTTFALATRADLEHSAFPF